LINLPVGIAALALALKLPADRGSEHAPALDRYGSVLATLWLGALCYGLIALGENRAVDGSIAIAAALPLAFLFVRIEARATAPMMPLSLFRNREFSGANALTVLLYAALGGALFLLPFLLIQVHGYSALAAGAAFLPFSATMGLGSRWAGGLVDKVGARTPLVLGSALAAAGYVTLGFSGDAPSYWTGVLPGLLLLSIGMTIAVPPLTTTVFNATPDDMTGTASGINNAAARAGSLLAVAALGLAIGGSAMDVDADALLRAYRLTMWAAGVLAVLGSLTAALTIAPRRAAHSPSR
jgi:predicted MFS family arabinose efflux permease